MSYIFKEFKIKNNFISKNRIAMASVYSGYNGHSKGFRDFYLKRAAGGAGIVILPQSTGDPLDSWNNKDFYLGFKKLLDEANRYNTKMILQLYENIEDINTISKEFLQELPKRFAKAAKAIKYSGFHGLEIHGAHYTPFMSLLSPLQNKRDDEYGGSLENRTRVIYETVKEVKKAIGEFPLLYRVSVSEFAQGGLEIDEVIEFIKQLECHGVDCIDVSAGSIESKGALGVSPKANTPKKCFMDLAKKVKNKVKIPVICVGRIDTLEEIEEAIDSKSADIVSIGRPLICDPDFVNKLGMGEEPIKCLHCNKGCLTDSLLIGKPINCFVNPIY